MGQPLSTFSGLNDGSLSIALKFYFERHARHVMVTGNCHIGAFAIPGFSKKTA